MKFIVRSALMLFFSYLVALPTFANPALLNHVQAASQAMTAMYMKALSEGSPKYQRDLEKYKKEALESLQAYQSSGDIKAKEWLTRWNRFSVDLKVDYSEDYGWDVVASTRRDARSYLSDIYEYINTNALIQESNEQALLALVEVQVITARFFDVASSYNGTVSLSLSDVQKMEPKATSKQFKQRIMKLAESNIDKRQAKNLISAKEKWEFVEESVVNYSDESAYFLVYATKNKIAKVLQNFNRHQANAGV